MLFYDTITKYCIYICELFFFDYLPHSQCILKINIIFI
jgi:hypothetical protein